MLDVEVVPELALRHKYWEFVLGMPIQQMIDILRRHDQTIKVVDFWYNDKAPFTSNIIIVLPNDGLRFYFEPFLQRLRLIEIFDLSKIHLRYWSQYFNSSTVVPTIQEILRIFGSTKPLLPADTGGEYRLCYRGITFYLKSSSGDFQLASPRSVSDCSSMSSVDSQSALFVNRLFVYLGNNLNESKISLELPSSCFLHNVFLDLLEVVRTSTATEELRFHLITQELPTNMTREPRIRRFVRSLRFGDSVQDVLSALGSPSRIFYKTEDKMKIHLPQSYRLDQPRRSDYFFNYFTLGVDILFDAECHHVTKFVLHTNQPGEYAFNTYFRCMFEIPLAVNTTGSALTDKDPDNEVVKDVKFIGSTEQGDQLIVTPFINWSTIHQRLEALVDVEPVVIHRDARPLQNPFGPTHAYGYQDIIFEIIPTNGFLSSVTLYAPVPTRT